MRKIKSEDELKSEAYFELLQENCDHKQIITAEKSIFDEQTKSFIKTDETQFFCFNCDVKLKIDEYDSCGLCSLFQ